MITLAAIAKVLPLVQVLDDDRVVRILGFDCGYLRKHQLCYPSADDHTLCLQLRIRLLLIVFLQFPQHQHKVADKPQ